MTRAAAQFSVVGSCDTEPTEGLAHLLMRLRGVLVADCATRLDCFDRAGRASPSNAARPVQRQRNSMPSAPCIGPRGGVQYVIPSRNRRYTSTRCERRIASWACWLAALRSTYATPGFVCFYAVRVAVSTVA